MKFSNQTFYSFLFILCIVVSFFPNYELTFLVWLSTILISSRQKYSYKIAQYILIFSGIVLIALISSIFYSNQLFNSIKDFTYLVKPILGLLVGYQLYDKIAKKPLNTFLNAGIVLSSIHSIPIIRHMLLLL